jgi:hypothetical protein
VHTTFWLGSLKGGDHRRHRRRWKDNIKMNLGEIGIRDLDWIRLAHDRDRWRVLVNTVMSLRVP